MNNLSKNLVCVVIRNGVQIWLEQERAENLKKILSSTNKPQFIDFENEFINTADITGVFSAIAMEDITRRKNGQWKCERNNWHNRGEKCQPEFNCFTEKDLKCIVCGKRSENYIKTSKGKKCSDCLYR